MTITFAGESIRARIVAEARSWAGTPYHHCARVKGVGVDCAQLLIGVLSAVGAIPAINPAYPPDWHLHRGEELFLGWLQHFGDPIAEAALLPGDVIVWRYGRCYSHGSIYVGNGEIMHSYIRVGCQPGRLDESYLRDRPRQSWRIRGLDDGR